MRLILELGPEKPRVELPPAEMGKKEGEANLTRFGTCHNDNDIDVPSGKVEGAEKRMGRPPHHGVTFSFFT